MFCEIKDVLPGYNHVEQLNKLCELAADVKEDGWIVDVNAYCGRASFALGANKKESVLLTCYEKFPDAPHSVPDNVFGNVNKHYNHFTFCINMEEITNLEIIWNLPSRDQMPQYTKFTKKVDLIYFNNCNELDVVAEYFSIFGNDLADGAKVVLNNGLLSEEEIFNVFDFDTFTAKFECMLWVLTKK